MSRPVRFALLIALAIVVTSGLTFALLPRESESLRLTGVGKSYRVTVVIDEARTGTVDVRLDTTHSVAAVSLSAAMAGMGHLTPEITARQEGPGRFSARGEVFLMTGLWELAIRLQGESGVEVITVGVAVPE